MAPGNNGPWAGLPRCGSKGLPVGLAGQAGLGNLVPLCRSGRGALALVWPRAADELGFGAGTGRSTAHLALLQALSALETSDVSHPLRLSAACCPPGWDWGRQAGCSLGLGWSELGEAPGGGQGPGPSSLLSAEVVPELCALLRRNASPMDAGRHPHPSTPALGAPAQVSLSLAVLP